MLPVGRFRANPATTAKPVVKPPVWTWEIPLYFFFGGVAGMAAVIACAGLFLGQLDLMRARALDRGRRGDHFSRSPRHGSRPAQRFFNMLRVFKYRSPMSIGAWILSLFGAFAVRLAGP